MQKKISKIYFLFLLCLASVFWGGCDKQMEKYQNKTYGYTLNIPTNWGSVWIFPGSNDLVDEMEAIGPLPNNPEDWNEDIEIEIFNKENTTEKVFEEYKSLIDFYEEFRLKNNEYFTETKLNKSPKNQENCLTKEISVLQNGKYSRTHKLLENKNGLYVFSFDKKNNLHQKIIDSIELE